MAQAPLSVLVTGANKGIGLEIVRQLTLQLPTSPFARSRNASDFLVYLTARNEQRGLDAVQALEGDQSLSKALKKHGGPVDVRYRQLDISDESSIKALAKWVKTEHPEGIDVLVQNAGIATKGSRFDSEVVRETIKTNYDGTRLVAEALLPHIKKDGRVVHVSSMASSLRKVSNSIASRFREARSVDEISALLGEFKDHVDKGDYEQAGWPSSAYGVSKMGMTGLTRVLAAKEKEEGGSRLINCCCPGYVSTDMSSHKGHLTVEQGADTPVWLAIGDIDFSGAFKQQRKDFPW